MQDEETAQEIEVNEATFHNAVNNASYFARRRLFKKMEKVVFPRNGAMFTDVHGKYFNHRSGRPPSDLETYVTNFVRTHYNPEWRGEKA